MVSNSIFFLALYLVMNRNKNSLGCLKMKILKLPPYYAPEQISSSHLTNDLEKAYVEAGYEIEIYCPTPTRGVSEEVRSIYKNKKYEEKFDGKIKIHRFPMFREQKNTVLRALRYILVNLIQFYKGCRAKDIDLIMASSTPPTQGLMCGLLKRIKGVPFVYTLQDVFPDSLVNAKMTKKGSLIWKIGRKIEDFTYRSADKIIVISEDFRNNIIQKGVPEDKITVIPNWVNIDNVYPIERKVNILFDRYNLDREKFYVCYSGNIGHSQNLELLIAAAKEIEKTNEDIHFVIIGDGVAKASLEQQISTLGLKNITILPFQPYDDIAHVFSLGDVGLLISKPGIGGSSVPSKTWGYMAAGRPILASFDSSSEINKMIISNNLGLVSNPKSTDMFIDSILRLYHNHNYRNKLGHNGVIFVKNNIPKEVCLKKYLSILIEGKNK